MYLDQIKSELVEAQDVLNKFISDENNIKLIQQAALLISDSFKQGGRFFLVAMAALIVMQCICGRTHGALS
ncbi:phosphoheptose isomerase [Rodentibacter pneumotropicus]|uniref:Phosphoheptose isomerase n=1 Tax=Rodentibacter pneumotropicus TaxID=758 RepID=A0A3S4XVB9_9PAST|nr:phosphoheptose isomerase [Rodentibacter pneumotropicus]